MVDRQLEILCAHQKLNAAKGMDSIQRLGNLANPIPTFLGTFLFNEQFKSFKDKSWLFFKVATGFVYWLAGLHVPLKKAGHVLCIDFMIVEVLLT